MAWRFPTTTILGVTLLSVYGTGCVSLVPYTPQTGKVDELGRDSVELRLGELITQSTHPRYTSADVAENHIHASAVSVAFGPWWGATTHSEPRDVYYRNIEDVEVYDNNVVYLRGIGNQVIFQVTYPSRETALEFADLVNSLRHTALHAE